MQGFISATILLIATVSTLLLGGAGLGIYKYQEMKRGNAQIRADLSEQKDIEIALLREKIEQSSVDDGSIATSTEETVAKIAEAVEDGPTEQVLQKPSSPVIPVVTTPVTETVAVPIATPPTPTIQADVYGMTPGEWSSLESQIPSLEKRISEIDRIKSDLEDSLDSIEDIEKSFLDWIPLLTTSGQKIAQDGLTIAAESRTLTYQEIDYAKSIISAMNKVIDAIDNRNGDSYESNFAYAKSQQDRWGSITSESKAKYTLLLSTYKNFSYYISGD